MRRLVLLGGFLVFALLGLVACAGPQTPTVVPIAVTATPTFTMVIPEATATPGLSLTIVVLDGELLPKGKPPTEWFPYSATTKVRPGEYYQLVFPGGYSTPLFRLEWKCLENKGCAWTAIPHSSSGKEWYATSFGPPGIEEPGVHFVGRGILLVHVPIGDRVFIRGVIFLSATLENDTLPCGSPPSETVILKGSGESILVEP